MHELPVFFHLDLPFIGEVPSYVTHSWIAMIIILAIAILVGRSLKLIPSGTQNFVETVVEMLLNFSRNTIGHLGEYFFPLIGTLGFYIFVCNFLGLIPGFEAPTGDLNTTASMAIPVFLATHYYGIKLHKGGYIKHFVGPIRSVLALPLMILMFFIEVIGHLARPVTLSVRLFGNMMAKHELLIILLSMAPWFVPIPILVLGVLVSVVQTAVFVILTALYLTGSVEEAH
jgi:F-type H+-transporting ATPase subunit a